MVDDERKYVGDPLPWSDKLTIRVDEWTAVYGFEVMYEKILWLHTTKFPSPLQVGPNNVVTIDLSRLVFNYP